MIGLFIIIIMAFVFVYMFLSAPGSNPNGSLRAKRRGWK